jgi:hypothetical protein
MTDEEIRAERERRYLEIWPTIWDQVEFVCNHGDFKLREIKSQIRKELPYSHEAE